MTNYANSSNITTLLGTINETTSDDIDSLITYALGAADNWIDSHTDDYNFTSTPALIQQAAEYKTIAIILRTMYDTSTDESPTVLWYEKEAMNYLESYIAQNKNIETDTNPYSSSQTPNGNYLKTKDSYPTDAPANSEIGVRRNRRKILNNDNNTW